VFSKTIVFERYVAWTVSYDHACTYKLR